VIGEALCLGSKKNDERHKSQAIFRLFIYIGIKLAQGIVSPCKSNCSKGKELPEQRSSRSKR
jgi:hypothetical protein